MAYRGPVAHRCRSQARHTSGTPQALTAQRAELTAHNRLSQRIEAFAARALTGLDRLDFNGRQQLLRIVLEDIRVQGWRVELRLRIPLDQTPPDGIVALAARGWPQTGRMTAASGASSVFAGFRFPPEVISVAGRWYLRYGLSYRDVEELLAERGVTVDHVTVYRWVQRFTPEFVEAARPCRHAPGDRWFVDETYVRVAGQWTYLYRAVDQHGQVIDVLLSVRRDLAAARRFFIRALRAGTIPAEVTTDRAQVSPRVIDELVPSALHIVEQYANNPVEADHGRLKARLRPMRGLKRHRSARILAAGHAFVQNLRRGHYDIATDVPITTGYGRPSTTWQSPYDQRGFD